jgi:hypothetical protein
LLAGRPRTPKKKKIAGDEIDDPRMRSTGFPFCTGGERKIIPVVLGFAFFPFE